MTRPGVNVFRTQETTLRELQATQANLRGGAGKNYFNRKNRTNPLSVDSKVTLTQTESGMYRATLASGEQRMISTEVGAALDQKGIGYSGNVLASASRGKLTGTIFGYQRTAMGFGNAGGLTGNALLGKKMAIEDARKAMTSIEAKGIATKEVGFTAEGTAQRMWNSGQRVYSSAGELIQTQKGVAERATTMAAEKAEAIAAGKAYTGAIPTAGKTITTKSVGVSTADDLLAITPQGQWGQGIARAGSAEGTGAQRLLTKDVSRAAFLEKGEIGAAEGLLERGFLKTYGARGTMGILKGAGGKEAYKLLGARMANSALAVANPIMTAATVYDLTKLAATTVIGGGAKFARDAMKSIQGSINKPAFGMGFKDNEVAATSRARGVMAIQNSRLNARSSLGTEGAMMAARFG